MSLESLQTYALLDSIQQEIAQVAQHRRKDLPTHDLVKTILDSLDIIIHRSYDQHTTVSIENEDDDESGDGMKVTYGDMTTAKRIASGWLLKVISGEYADGDDASMDRAAHVMAHFSGRGGAGAITRTWHFEYLTRDGDKDVMDIKVHEPTFIENDLGFKTWGSAPLLARKLIQENLIPDIGDARILELGTGTGMVGLMCAELGAREVYMTDYHPSVLKNVAGNIELNGCQNVQIHKLDFFEIAGLTPRTTPIEDWENQTFDIVIGSDLLYEMDHALSLPHVVAKFMKDVFHFLIPLRARYQEEVVTFESKMTELGFTAVVQEDLEYEEQEAQISQYRYYEWRR
ncbi:hypothetical protein K450DRAFT_240757 [Umbelopsis ramanniana AG]|uniref:Uncharacterized protein n=1 Tax=Umbelopsis ramanniana AG TaxID=1314678 RepID=A0AAD5EB34_UMBRA|nr:uncharacterized protein K450DRAFT_240757 [Umbelopsis ramanniana AG]KAI8579635.1 hypothetical protein K450DRAFT_240757 [Umbelopsis ramanniana AG]